MTIATHNFRQSRITNKSLCPPLNEEREREWGDKERKDEKEERQDLPMSLNLNLTL